jgi:hypothetical protein
MASTAGSNSKQPTTRLGCGGRKESAMKIRIQMVIEAENGKPENVYKE